MLRCAALWKERPRYFGNFDCNLLMKHYIIVSSFGTIFICLLHTYIEFTLHSQSQLGVKAGKVEVQD